MIFNIGDKAVHPGLGVGVIQSIQSQEISGVRQDFYMIEIVSSGATLMISTGGKSKFLRMITPVAQIEKVFSILKSPAKVAKATWKRRVDELNEKLKYGGLYELAEVLRDLNYLKIGKDLSFSEKQMFNKAKSLIVEEISLAKAIDTKLVESDVNSCLCPA